MTRCTWFAIVMVMVMTSLSAGAQTAVRAGGRDAPVRQERPATPARSGTNPFLGSVPTGALSPEPMVLTLSAAVERALEHNLGMLVGEQEVEIARGSRWRSLSGLLPEVTTQSGQTWQTTNLAAFGLDPSLFPGVPSIVGPFGVFDARVFVSQPLLNLSALNDVHRSTHALDAAKLESRNARDLVVLVGTDQYLQAATAANRIAAVRTQVATAEELLTLATDLHDAGVTPGIDVVRAQVQLRAQQQRLIAVENDFAKKKLQLARAIGIPSAQPLQLSDTGTIVPRPDLTLEQALPRASAARADYQAAVARLRAAESDYRAAQTDVLPSLHVNADYGAVGSSPGDARRTYSASATVQVPLFDAGRHRSRLLETAAVLRERQAEAADFAERIASEVRSAFLDVQAAEQQLAVSREQVDLAHQELALAQTRFSAGVTSNLEVIQAQDEVAAATESELTSAYA
ncbi:MAG: TolC family protein, partial [Vicinamibacterales bacterium]